ncbi:MAG: hypothetical protein H7X89_03980 [Rhizobiales bacterium]|nr:hypothetical protein [Hyphomicrobiales bacterium]
MQKPEDYRKRAVFLRKLADQAMTEALKESYLELAANWDALADEADGKGTQEGPGQDAPQPG